MKSLSRLVGVTATALALGAGSGCTTPAPPTADPVVIVAGTVTPAVVLAPLKAQLEYDNFKSVSTFELSNLGLADITQSAAALKAHVDEVRARTGAAKVDIVSHSQGGIVARYYLKNLGGSSVVDTFVSMSAPNNGATATNILSTLLGASAPVTIAQMTTGSAFLNDLNAGADVPAPVRAVALYSRDDEIVNPVETSRHDVGVNVRIQDQCPLLVVGHVGMISNRAVYTGVRSALLNQSVTIDCLSASTPL